MGGARSCPICSYSPLSQVSLAVIHPCKLLLFGSRCKSTFNVDKQDFQEIDNISCPLPWCNYTWCKLCQQSISANGPKHSCDGLSEMKDLIKRSGWKYCPSKLGYHLSGTYFYYLKKITGCKTPIEKVSGCNHMTVCVYLTLEIMEYQWLEKCVHCHTEFCYSCGGAYRSGHSCQIATSGLGHQYDRHFWAL